MFSRKRRYVINFIACLMVVVFACYTISIPVHAATNNNNALSFQMNRIRAYYTSSGNSDYYLKSITSSGGTSGVGLFNWGGFAIGLGGPMYCNWQAGGVYNISSPSLIDITVRFRDSNKSFGASGDCLLVTDKPSWKSSPSSSDFPDPYAGTGLMFWSGYSCGAYQIDRTYVDDYEVQLTFHFAVNPPETYGLPYQDMFCLNISWYAISGASFATNAGVISWNCTDTTTAIVEALNNLSNISNPSVADQSKMNDFGQASGEQAGQISSATSGANDFNKPIGDDINPDIDSMYDVDGMTAYNGVLSQVTGWSITLTSLLTVFGVALVAYVLFGKR